MTVDEAIETSEYLIEHEHTNLTTNHEIAIGLGIEALKEKLQREKGENK